MAKIKLNRVTPADWIRLGPEVAKVKSQMSPKRWAQVVATAHKQGWTVASALDASTPAALKQRTQGSLRNAAQRQVSDAYAPAYAEFDASDKTAAGLRQKRLADQAAYDQWSNQKAAEISGQINAAQQQYLDTIKQSSDAQIQQAQQTAATFAGKAGAGGISDLSGSTAQANVTAGAQAAQARANAAKDYAAAQGPTAAVRAAAVPLAFAGAAAQRHAQIEGEYGKTVSDIFSGRLKLNTSRAADQVKAYADLVKTEMDKASANRDFQGLQAQLQSKADIAAQQHSEFLIGQRGLTKRANIAASTTIRGQNLSHADRVAQRAADATQKALDRANRLTVAAQRASAADASKAKGPAARKASRSQVQAINTLAQLIRAGSFIGPDGKRHKTKASTLIGVLGANKGQVDVATRIAQGRQHVLYNPAALGILPEDLGLLR